MTIKLKKPEPMVHGDEWGPQLFHNDPTTNALYNIAASLDKLADATNGLLYGLKYGKRDGMSIAEAVEVAGKGVAESIESGLHDIGQAIEWNSTEPPGGASGPPTG